MNLLKTITLISLCFLISGKVFAGFIEDTNFNDVAVPLAQSASAWGDYTNNGYWDLIMVGRDSEDNRRTILYKNNGTSFEKIEDHGLKDINLQSLHYGDVLWVDIDNSGTLDLVMAGYDGTGENVWIYKNNNGEFELVRKLTHLDAASVAAGDFNNNGFADLAVGSRSANEPILYTNDGEGFTREYVEFSTKFSAQDLMWADLNNDGWMDLVGIGQDEENASITVIYKNNSGESFEENISSGESAIIEEGFAQGTAVAGDYNNDGWMDLAMAGTTESGDATVIYTNQKTASISFSSGTFNLPGVYNSDLAFGDYNNDGSLDLAISGNGSTEPLLRVYSGSDTFNSYIEPDSNLGLHRGSVNWADYNNSKALDLVVTGEDDSETPHVKLFKNDVDSADYDKNNLPSKVEDFKTRYYDETLYIMWNDPPKADTETPKNGVYYNFRVGTSSGTDNLVSRSYGSPLMGNYLTKVTSDTIENISDRIILGEYKNIRAMDISGSDYYWAVQTIDTGLGYSWANPDYSGWSEQQVLIDTSPPVGYPSKPGIPGEFIYDKNIEFNLDWGTSRDPQTGIYGAYIEIEENGKIVESKELWEEGTSSTWGPEGSRIYMYEGDYNKSYRIRCKTRHGFTEPDLATETYKTGQFEGADDENVLWDPESQHYTHDGPHSGWSNWSETVTPVELLSVDNNFIRDPGPGRQAATIDYVVQEEGYIKLRVFNIMGELVKSLKEGYVSKGPGICNWYGVTQSGDTVASGTYFINIQLNGVEETEKVVVVK
ncbi:MAG: FG-GAP repeat domain-containing protein [Elusimicrobiota bacterium]